MSEQIKSMHVLTDRKAKEKQRMKLDKNSQRNSEHGFQQYIADSLYSGLVLFTV